jgi:colicin import membrane protein
MKARTIAVLAAAGLLGAARGREDSAVAGKVADVSVDTLTVKTDDGRSVTLRVTGSTQVTVDGRQRSIGDLQQGAQVRASYDASSGEKTATEIDAGEPQAGTQAR